jgi:hypothetical protein
MKPAAIKILFLSANPVDTSSLHLDEELRLINERIRSGEHRKLFDVRCEPAMRATDLPRALMEHQPQVVHFSGHGAKSGELLLKRDGDLRAHPIPPATLSLIFSVLKGSLQCVVLNACYSEAQAHVIAQHVPCVVGMSRAVPDATAIAFAGGFYEAMAFGRSVAEAFQLGLAHIELSPNTRAASSEIPRLLVQPGVCAETLVLARSQPPLVTPEGSEISRAQIRRLLGAQIPTPDFEQFCIDYFFDVYHRFGSGMDRIARTNLLLQLKEPGELLQALRDYLSIHSLHPQA